MQDSINMIIFAILSSTIISLFVTPYLIKFGRSRRLFDLPAPRKTHKKQIVHIGGTSVLIGYFFSLAIASISSRSVIIAEATLLYLRSN